MNLIECESFNDLLSISVDDFNSLSSALVMSYVNEGELEVILSDSENRILVFTVNVNEKFSCYFEGNFMVIESLPFITDYSKVGFNIRLLKAVCSLLKGCSGVEYLFLRNVVEEDFCSALDSIGFIKRDSDFYIRLN